MSLPQLNPGRSFIAVGDHVASWLWWDRDLLATMDRPNAAGCWEPQGLGKR